MSTTIKLMIAAQQRANAARRAMISMDPQLPSYTRANWRRVLGNQAKAALAEADRYADLALRQMEQGDSSSDLFALVELPEEE